jgi:Cof subfamily protein (haloacid dehalogenase superfamily)
MDFPFRLAAIDLDDTLLGPDKQVSAANRMALAHLRSHNVRIVLASGRRHQNMARFHQQLNLGGYLISAQGALAKHAETGEIVYDAGVEAGLGREILEEGVARGLSVIAYHEEAVYGHGPAEYLREYARLSGDAVTERGLDEFSGKDMEKVLWAGEPGRIAELMPTARDKYAGRADTVITEPMFLEFTRHGVHKASALVALSKYLGIEQREVVAFGDGNNDVAMLKWAGLGVAMHHARASAKEAADMVASDGDPETSFARAVAAMFIQARVVGAAKGMA